MNIEFEEIGVKNFLSFGNNLQTFNFKTGLHLVQGHIVQNKSDKNGAGKSSLFVDALMWGLFGKTIKKLTIKGILNSINQKNLEVYIRFSIAGTRYTIERGAKPDYLRLYDPNSDQYPKPIECSSKGLTQKKIDVLLGAGFETYKNLLIMCSNYATPFLSLTAGARREVIEDVLGVTVIGDMSDRTKTICKTLNTDIGSLDEHIMVLKGSIDTLEGQNVLLEKKSVEFEKEKKEKIERLKRKCTEKIDTLKSLMAVLKDAKEKKALLQGIIDNRKKGEKINNEMSVKLQMNTQKIATLEAKNERLVKNPICQECGTKTSDDHVLKHIIENEKKIEECKRQNEKLSSLVVEYKKKLKRVKAKQEKIEAIINKGVSTKHRIASIKTDILDTKALIEETKKETNSFDLSSGQEKLDELKEDYDTRVKSQGEKEYDVTYYNFIKKILSDSGVKTYIIKRILPFFNKKVNQYLSLLGLNITIEFDINLDEHIKSRNRDKFKYGNFSGGEKKRIDAALLLTLLDLANLQNTIDSNLLILDEIFDSALDANGITDTLNLLKDKVIKEKKAIYVISHRNNIDLELFDDIITVVKDDDFSFIQ